VRLDTALWRAIAVYRVAALLYAAGSMAVYTDTYARPGLGWAVLACMAAWTGLAAFLYADPRRRGWPLLLTDLALTVAALLSSVLVITAGRIEDGDLVLSWAAGQNSAVDQRDISKGRDIGNVIVQRKTGGALVDVPYDVTFAFAFFALRPRGRIVDE